MARSRVIRGMALTQDDALDSFHALCSDRELLGVCGSDWLGLGETVRTGGRGISGHERCSDRDIFQTSRVVNAGEARGATMLNPPPGDPTGTAPSGAGPNPSAAISVYRDCQEKPHSYLGVSLNKKTGRGHPASPSQAPIHKRTPRGRGRSLPTDLYCLVIYLASPRRPTPASKRPNTRGFSRQKTRPLIYPVSGITKVPVESSYPAHDARVWVVC